MRSSGPALRIDPPAWLRRPDIRRLLDVLGEARFVGGAVRDALLGRPAGDLDLATPLPPAAVMARLAEAGIRALPTGLAHGTVTAMLESCSVEITSLRRDVETDGRHAVVAFTADWDADAARRDFTMNALYLDAEGGVWDPVGGLEDCRAGQVRFVGAPARRIREDVLRLLRFYRFFAHYGRAPADAAARAACRDLAPLAKGLAGERLRGETLKLLAAADPVPALRLMIEDRVWQAILPPPGPLEPLARLIALDPETDPLRRLAVLVRPGDAGLIAETLRLSTRDGERLRLLTQAPRPALEDDAPAVRAALWRLGPALYRDLVQLEAAARGMPEAVPALLALAEAWTVPVLPVGGIDALALGMAPGPALGAALKAVEAWWAAGDFAAGREACLAYLGGVIAEGATTTQDPGPASAR